MPHDRLATNLSAADDRIRLSVWLPPRGGIAPKIRFGRHWINVLWALPVIFVTLAIAIAGAQALRALPAAQTFIARYPGIPESAASVSSGFPAWLRLTHFLNLFLMTFIVRSGVQVFYARFASRGEADFANRVLSAMRHEFGGHVEKGAPKAGS